jgi:hypothetical protein
MEIGLYGYDGLLKDAVWRKEVVFGIYNRNIISGGVLAYKDHDL